MNKINEAFANTIGPVMYKGEMIQLYDHVSLKKGDIIKLEIDSTNSDNEQGVSFHVIQPLNERLLRVNDTKLEGFTIWESTKPAGLIEIEIVEDCKVSIWNAWKEIVADGSQRIVSAMQNAAMKVKVEDNKKKYYCNDGIEGENFDDIIFSIEVVQR